MKKSKKIIIVLILLFIVGIIYFIFRDYGVTYLFFDYDNVIKIRNQNYKKIKINKVKRLNYSKASLLTKENTIEGYIGIDDKEYKVNFYDENMNKNNDGIIKIGNLNLTNKSNLITNKITEKDLGVINDIITDNEIDIDRGYITKAKLNDRQTIYSVLDYASDHIVSIIVIKDSNNDDIVVYDKNITDFKQNYSKLSGIITFENDMYPILILSSITPDTDNGQCSSIYTYNTKLNKYEPKINCE